MPEVGEIKRKRDVGFVGNNKLIWHACIDCGKERWVELEHGEPSHLRCRSCGEKANGQNHYRWNGGRFIHIEGYVLIKLQPDSPFYQMTNSRGYVLEHRLIMAKHLKRCLQPIEKIHHRGITHPQDSKENKQDNRLENLGLFANPNDHTTNHWHNGKSHRRRHSYK